MFCNYCGREIKEGAKFCPYCGRSFALQTDEPDSVSAPAAAVQASAPPKTVKKRSKAKIIVLLVVIVVVLAAVAGAVGFFTSPAWQLSRDLGNGAYSSALSAYAADIQDSGVQKLLANWLLSGAVSDVVEEYGADSISYDEALAYLSAVSQMTALTASEEAGEQIVALQTLYASKQAYELAESYYETGDYEAALAAYQEVDESDAERYEDAQSKIASATELYRTEIVDKVGSPSTVAEYETAIRLLNSALAVLTVDEELVALLDTCETELSEMVKASALSEATDAIASEDYSRAFEVLENALIYNPEDSDLLALISSAQAQYEEYITSEVESLVGENNYDDALNLLNQALSILPESTAIQTLYDTTYSNQPEKLNTLVLSDSSDYYQKIEDAEDTVGNIYRSSNMYEIWYHNGVLVDEAHGYGKYYLNREYTTIELTLAISSVDYTEACILTVYGDDASVLYTSGELNRTTAPQKISIDVSEVQWITFEANCSVTYYGTTSVHLLLIDPVLYKK